MPQALRTAVQATSLGDCSDCGCAGADDRQARLGVPVRGGGDDPPRSRAEPSKLGGMERS